MVDILTFGPWGVITLLIVAGTVFAPKSSRNHADRFVDHR